MRALTRSPLTAVAAAAAVLFSAGAADAACKKMGFLVNDYGKDGPSKDAQDLLDKHVAEWAAQNGIKNYTIGKKDVKCELYIDVILFDEHTCTASANVCWDEPGKEKPAKSAKKKSDEPEAKSAANDEKKSSEKQPAATEEKPAETAAEKPAAAAIETGAIQSEESKPAATPAASSDDAAARAAAAAERAAEAAERAAAAAERAAAASSKAASPSQLEMPAFGAGKPAEVAPVTPVEPKS
ncbi:MAG: hypothetical protein B7Y80_12565 [Hyphomicrobium sp. 32-62-53]|nr:MAG: hypothetical protein B7Z29_00345 [Hyphomicrobium sp. 12-62-95]OYX99329.1 MAG: hypothetical protein B7Y80_12565 [Hyphomicrobium sp. 32-62-53]